MARKNPDGSFELYPYEKLIGLIDRETDLRSALAELEEAGFDDERVYYFHGEKGLRILDLDGDEHGLLTMIVRALQKSISREAEEGMKAVKESMRRGSFFVTVLAETEEMKDSALDIFKNHEAYNIHYFHTLNVEQF
jgi:hypothetical protein